MKIMYIFPHPDDESFGPAAAMHAQLKRGHDVHLLTLTKGGATRQRFVLGVDVEQMGEIRHREMLAMEQALGLTSMTVLDFPDSGLKEMDPRVLEEAVKEQIARIEPHIVVTYPVHGISGFHDHLITHAVVKRAYLEMKDSGAAYLKRLAFYTIPDSGEPFMDEQGRFRLKHSEEALIDVVMPIGPEDREAMVRALNCYATYQSTIAATGVVEKVGDAVYFEIFDEEHQPPLQDLTQRIGS